MASETTEAELNAPDLDEGQIDVERFTLPDESSITDPYLANVWAEVRDHFSGGDYEAEDESEDFSAISDPARHVSGDTIPIQIDDAMRPPPPVATPPAIIPPMPPQLPDSPLQVGYPDWNGVPDNAPGVFAADAPGSHPPHPGLVYNPADHHYHKSGVTGGSDPSTGNPAPMAVAALSPIDDFPAESADPTLWGKITDFASSALTHVNLFLVAHESELARVGNLIDLAITTPEDMKRNGFLNAAGLSGTAGHDTPDSFQLATGIPGHVAAKVLATVLVKGWAATRKTVGFAEDSQGHEHDGKTGQFAPKGGEPSKGSDKKESEKPATESKSHGHALKEISERSMVDKHVPAEKFRDEANKIVAVMNLEQMRDAYKHLGYKAGLEEEAEGRRKILSAVMNRRASFDRSDA